MKALFNRYIAYVKKHDPENFKKVKIIPVKFIVLLVLGLSFAGAYYLVRYFGLIGGLICFVAYLYLKKYLK